MTGARACFHGQGEGSRDFAGLRGPRCIGQPISKEAARRRWRCIPCEDGLVDGAVQRPYAAEGQGDMPDAGQMVRLRLTGWGLPGLTEGGIGAPFGPARTGPLPARERGRRVLQG